MLSAYDAAFVVNRSEAITHQTGVCLYIYIQKRTAGLWRMCDCLGLCVGMRNVAVGARPRVRFDDTVDYDTPPPHTNNIISAFTKVKPKRRSLVLLMPPH